VHGDSGLAIAPTREVFRMTEPTRTTTNSSRRINRLSRAFGGRRYLEIGVLHGNTFLDVEVAQRTAVDPGFAFDTDAYANETTRFFRQKSDDFFAAEPILPAYDVALIDGMHTFEQVVRDLSNVLIRTHHRSVIILDDTVPDDLYSVIKDPKASYEYRQKDGVPARGWQGDVYKTVFYIHDFVPCLNYRTIMGQGNPQTLVWRANGIRRTPRFGDLERISRLSYTELHEHFAMMQPCSEDEALAICIAEVSAL
jgi:hypothetical protein